MATDDEIIKAHHLYVYIDPAVEMEARLSMKDARADERTKLKATERAGGKSNEEIRAEIRYCNDGIEKANKNLESEELIGAAYERDRIAGLTTRKNALLWVLE